MKRIPILGLAGAAGVIGVLLAPLPLGSTHIYNSTVIERAPPEVFSYVTTPANWPRWHPSSLSVSGATDHPLLVGEQVKEDFVVAGYQGRVLWTVVQRQAPLRWAISGQIEDGGKGMVSYRLTQVNGGTKFEREFEYARPNLLFLLSDMLGIRARITAESAEALRRLKAVLEGTAPAVRTVSRVEVSAARLTSPRA
ncbi:MAG: SRPBCC family protein [Paucibacter sp.]|nr:SRPBCC family protein [Roseateles sp.]